MTRYMPERKEQLYVAVYRMAPNPPKLKVTPDELHQEHRQWLQGLADTYGARLLRVKGIVSVEEDPHAVAVHAIQHLVAPPEFLSVPGSDSRVVFITRGLEPGDVLPAWPCAAGAVQAPRRSPAGSTLPLQPGAGAFSGAATRR